MPYANKGGVRIHYDVEGDGHPLVLQHGLTSSLTAWRDYGYTEAIKGFQLILIDARGHGSSDKPHSIESYTPEAMTGDVVAVLDDLEINKAHYWGFSMGAMMGYRLPVLHPTRFRSLILGGMSPYPHDSREEKEFWGFIENFTRVGAEKGTDAVFSLVEGGGITMDEPWKQHWRGNDWAAIYAAFRGMRNWPSVESTLPACRLRCLVYAGDKDPFSAGARRSAAALPSASFVSIPGADHTGAFDFSSPIMPHIKRFLSEFR